MLHIINNTNTLENCLLTIQADDCILFIENGVLEILKTDFLPIKNIYFFALEPDLAARGLLNKLPTYVTLIIYDGFVELTVKHFPILNWQ